MSFFLSNEESICLAEGDKVKSDISANLFWLRRLTKVLQPPISRNWPLGHMAGMLSKHKGDKDLKLERKQRYTGRHKPTFQYIPRSILGRDVSGLIS